MREIKFRAWSKKNKKMYHTSKGNYWLAIASVTWGIWDSSDNSIDGNSYVNEDKAAVLMQYTGLKDKNGKEIFEGDILRNPESQKSDFYVHFDCCWNAIYKGNFALCLSPVLKEKDGCEIIGNIYENPELIKT